MNPEIAEFVEIIDSVGCAEVGQPLSGVDGEEDEMLCIEPGETYEVLFKLNIGKINIARSFVQD